MKRYITIFTLLAIVTGSTSVLAAGPQRYGDCIASGGSRQFCCQIAADLGGTPGGHCIKNEKGAWVPNSSPGFRK